MLPTQYRQVDQPRSGGGDETSGDSSRIFLGLVSLRYELENLEVVQDQKLAACSDQLKAQFHVDTKRHPAYHFTRIRKNRGINMFYKRKWAFCWMSLIAATSYQAWSAQGDVE